MENDNKEININLTKKQFFNLLSKLGIRNYQLGKDEKEFVNFLNNGTVETTKSDGITSEDAGTLSLIFKIR